MRTKNHPSNLQHKARIDLKNVMPFTGYLISGTLTVCYISSCIKIIFESIVKPLENKFIYKYYK